MLERRRTIEELRRDLGIALVAFRELADADGRLPAGRTARIVAAAFSSLGGSHYQPEDIHTMLGRIGFVCREGLRSRVKLEGEPSPEDLQALYNGTPTAYQRSEPERRQARRIELDALCAWLIEHVEPGSCWVLDDGHGAVVRFCVSTPTWVSGTSGHTMRLRKSINFDRRLVLPGSNERPDLKAVNGFVFRALVEDGALTLRGE